MSTQIAAKSQTDELNEQMQVAVDLQFEMMGDMYNKMTVSCHKKCIAPRYKDPDLTKGESVCIDRCVGKFLDLYERIGTKINSMTLADEQTLQKMQQTAAAPN